MTFHPSEVTRPAAVSLLTVLVWTCDACDAIVVKRCCKARRRCAMIALTWGSVGVGVGAEVGVEVEVGVLVLATKAMDGNVDGNVTSNPVLVAVVVVVPVVTLSA